MTQKPYPEAAKKAPVTEKQALVYIDIYGPFHRSRHGFKYIASIINDATRYKWILLVKTKDGVFSKFKELLPYAENESKK